ncbi:MAG: DUF1003 domain-containing protein [Fimbriimonas sp.]
MAEQHTEALKNARLRRMRNSSVLDVVQRNIDSLLDHERKALEQLPFEERLAERITTAAGSAWFLYANVAFFAAWIVLNLGFLPFKPFDPYPYGLLTMIVSLEAIILAIFVLVSQNRMQVESDRRAELDVQVNLLTEYEITQVLKLTVAIARKLECSVGYDAETEALMKEIHPEDVLEHIEQRRNNAKGAKPESEELPPAVN